ncbi:Pycsar system effector family protein [Longispora urticae]
MNLERSWASLQQVIESQKFADTKAGAILAADGLLGGFVLAAMLPPNSLSASPVRFVLLSGTLAVVLASIGYCLRTLIPRIEGGVPDSLLYFRHVARAFRYDQHGFTRRYRELMSDPELIGAEIAQQFWANCLIAQQKFAATARAIRLLAAALVLAGTALVAGGLGW